MVRRRKTVAKRKMKKRSASGKSLSLKVYLEPKSMWRKLWSHFDMS